MIRTGQFRGRPLGDLLLRGKQEALRAYEPLTETAYYDAALSRYQVAFDQLEAGQAGALAAFAGLVGLRPDDGVAAFHLKRLLNGCGRNADRSPLSRRPFDPPAAETATRRFRRRPPGRRPGPAWAGGPA